MGAAIDRCTRCGKHAETSDEGICKDCYVVTCPGCGRGYTAETFRTLELDALQLRFHEEDEDAPSRAARLLPFLALPLGRPLHAVADVLRAPGVVAELGQRQDEAHRTVVLAEGDDRRPLLVLAHDAARGAARLREDLVELGLALVDRDDRADREAHESTRTNQRITLAMMRRKTPGP